MNKTILLTVLISAALASGLFRSNRIVLERGRSNTIDFACGQQDSKGGASVLNRNYLYSFSNLPSWLRYANGRLTGLAPAGALGPWTIGVDYQGNASSNKNEKGSSTFSLCFADNQNQTTGNLSGVVFLKGLLSGLNPVASANAGSYVVLCPFRENQGNNSATAANNSAAPNNPFAELVANLTRQCDTLKAEVSASQTSITTGTAELAQVQANVNNAQKNLSALVKKQKQLQTRDGCPTADLDTQIENLQDQLNASQTSCDNAKLANDSNTQSVRDAEKLIESCKANLTELQQRKEQVAKAAAENLNNNQAKLQQARAKLVGNSDRATQAEAAATDAENKAQTARNEVSSTSDRVARAKAELEAAQSALAEATTRQTLAEQNVEIARASLEAAQ